MQVTKYTNGNGILIDIQALQGSKMNINPKISRLNTSAHRDMPISLEGGVHNSFAFFDWDWVFQAYQHLVESP